MKRKIFCIILLFVFLFSLEARAATWNFIWSDTVVSIPVGESIEDYKDIPTAKLYKDGALLNDAVISYSKEGDWLYFLKDVDTSTVGEYKVWYKAYETAKYLPGTCNGYKSLITFKVVDEIPPVIEVVNPILNVKRGSEFDLESNINVYDNYYQCTPKIIGNVDNMTVGEYKITVNAIDGSNNSATSEFIVNVYESTYPVITFDKPGNKLDIPLNDYYDVKSHFTAYDVIDGDLTNYIVFPSLDNSVIGEYEYVVSVKNNAGLETRFPIIINVIDNSIPEIILSSNQVMLNYKENFEDFDFSKYIKDIIDNSSVSYDNLSITHNISNTVGSYFIWYTYSDGTYSVTEILDVKLISYEKPIIEVSDINATINSNINYDDYITVSDESDPNILQSVEVFDDNVNYQKAGTYHIEVYAINSSGLSNMVRAKVVITDNNIVSNNVGVIITIIMLVIIILGLSGFLLYYFVIRKKYKSI